MISLLTGVLLAALHDLQRQASNISVVLPGYPSRDNKPIDVLIVVASGKRYRITITEETEAHD